MKTMEAYLHHDHRGRCHPYPRWKRWAPQSDAPYRIPVTKPKTNIRIYRHVNSNLIQGQKIWTGVWEGELMNGCSGRLASAGKPSTKSHQFKLSTEMTKTVYPLILSFAILVSRSTGGPISATGGGEPVKVEESEFLCILLSHKSTILHKNQLWLTFTYKFSYERRSWESRREK